MVHDDNTLSGISIPEKLKKIKSEGGNFVGNIHFQASICIDENGIFCVVGEGTLQVEHIRWLHDHPTN